MFPAYRLAGQKTKGSPRVCGDVSRTFLIPPRPIAFSPRMRGCFRPIQFGDFSDVVLPAYAGMFLVMTLTTTHKRSSPRVCGDVSSLSALQTCISLFSPRMRGCFLTIFAKLFRFRVLPAYAGMFLALGHSRDTVNSSPRVCGDVSRPSRLHLQCLKFSPRMRGCFLRFVSNRNHAFVLPAYAGMFLDTVPLTAIVLPFSPRMRGCFCSLDVRRDILPVLPAYAGMFPRVGFNINCAVGSPRVCGDVSAPEIV